MFLLQTELIQFEQAAALSCLIKRHGLQKILSEGLTPQGLNIYREMVAALKETADDVADLKRRAKRNKHDPELDNEINELERRIERGYIEYGSPGRLAVAGQIEVLPLDDRELLENAKPVTPDGRIAFDEAKVEARRDGMVDAAMKSGPCSFIVLGGSHDLSKSIEKLGRGKVQYIRVTTKLYREMAGTQDR